MNNSNNDMYIKAESIYTALLNMYWKNIEALDKYFIVGTASTILAKFDNSSMILNMIFNKFQEDGFNVVPNKFDPNLNAFIVCFDDTPEKSPRSNNVTSNNVTSNIVPIFKKKYDNCLKTINEQKLNDLKYKCQSLLKNNDDYFVINKSYFEGISSTDTRRIINEVKKTHISFVETSCYSNHDETDSCCEYYEIGKTSCKCCLHHAICMLCCWYFCTLASPSHGWIVRRKCANNIKSIIVSPKRQIMK